MSWVDGTCPCGKHYYHWAMRSWILLLRDGQQIVSASEVPLRCRLAIGPRRPGEGTAVE